MTALHKAAWQGDEKIVRLLVEVEADVKAIDDDGDTVLHEAVRSECEVAVVDFLLANRVGINAYYGTVLHYAALWGNMAMVQILLRRGARIDAVDIEGMVALDWVKEADHEAMIFFLTLFNP
jgi:ankyrin repeat protein